MARKKTEQVLLRLTPADAETLAILAKRRYGGERTRWLTEAIRAAANEVIKETLRGSDKAALELDKVINSPWNDGSPEALSRLLRVVYDAEGHPEEDPSWRIIHRTEFDDMGKKWLVALKRRPDGEYEEVTREQIWK
ncbi:MAG: hypothetical protein WBL15_01410 [Phycisphaerae bacterium]